MSENDFKLSQRVKAIAAWCFADQSLGFPLGKPNRKKKIAPQMISLLFPSPGSNKQSARRSGRQGTALSKIWETLQGTWSGAAFCREKGDGKAAVTLQDRN